MLTSLKFFILLAAISFIAGCTKNPKSSVELQDGRIIFHKLDAALLKQKVLRNPNIVLLVLSVKPSVCGCIDVDINCPTPNCSSTAFQKYDVNLGSLSLTNSVGTP